MKADDDIATNWSEAELSVLRSADLDCPPAGSVDRTLAGLGIGAGAAAAVATLGKAEAVSRLARGSLWFKWLGATLVGGSVVSTVIVGMHERSAVPAVPSAKVVKAPPTRVEPRASIGVLDSEVSTAPAPAPSSSVQTIPSNNRAGKGARSEEAMTAEIRAIDEARQLLRRGDAHGALAALDRYSQLVGRAGSLRAEATIVRIEALQSSGETQAAAALGERFLAKNPRSAYANYVRQILAHSK